jgi:tRNA pseudouridine38-40 synthase
MQSAGNVCVVEPSLHTAPVPDERLLEFVNHVETGGQCKLDANKMLNAPERSKPGWVMLSFCVGYLGFPFHGLQFQPNMTPQDTVEGTFLVACDRVGLLVDGLIGGKPAKHHMFARSCRTDAGVHAVRNQLTMAVKQVTWLAMGGPEGIKQALNAVLASIAPKPWLLPDERRAAAAAETTSTSDTATGDGAVASIQVFAVTRVSVDYCPRIMTTRRVYRFLVPLFALDRRLDAFAEPTTGVSSSAVEAEAWRACPVRLRHDYENIPAAEKNENPYVVLHDTSLNARIKASVDQLTGTLGAHFTRFVGRHRFHNFTGVEGSVSVAASQSLKIKPADNEAVRAIQRAAVVRDPLFIPAYMEGDATYALPFVLLQLEGMSFLLHMIRKIVGCCIAVTRGASAELIDKALDPATIVNTPLAPGSGLLLHLPQFDLYDARNTPTYPRLCCDWAKHRHEAMRFEESTVRLTIALREALDGKLLPHAARQPLLPCSLGVTAEDSASAAAAAAAAKTPGRYQQQRVVPTMTVFLRMLRMHNWEVRKSPYPVPTTRRKERKAARAATILARWGPTPAAAGMDATAVVEAAICATDDATTGVDEPPLKAHRSEDGEGDATAATPPRRIRLADRIDSGWITRGQVGAEDDAAGDSDVGEGDE